MSRSIPPKRPVAGFTLLEVLVALVVVAASLSPIGMLVATTVRGTRAIERQLQTLTTAQALYAALPDRDRLVLGHFSGELANHRWRVDVLPFVAPNLDPQRITKWVPQLVVVQVRSPDGTIDQISTIRLRPGADR